MKIWRLFLNCVVIVCVKCHLSSLTERKMPLFPGKIVKVIPALLGQRESSTAGTTADVESTISVVDVTDASVGDTIIMVDEENGSQDITPEGHDEQMPHPPMRHAGLPRELAVYPMPLENSDHELMFNVSWLPPLDAPAVDYSLEVRSETRTTDCDMPMCYEYNIPGDASWWGVPAQASPVAESCSVRPGCAYSVRLIPHPWDGHTAANLNVELDECVAGVCSCAHAPRLPAPNVKAQAVAVHGELFVNISWTLPPPRYPLRLPPTLNKQAYFVSIGKQMVSDAHPSPWFANTITRKVDTDGPVALGDGLRWLLLPVVERGERKSRNIVLDVKLLARVNLLDDRGCMGPAGNATAYDPVEARKVTIATYVVWAAAGGACVLAMVAIIAIGSRGAKRVLRKLRPAAVSAPLEPLRRRPAWLPLHLRGIRPSRTAGRSAWSDSDFCKRDISS